MNPAAPAAPVLCASGSGSFAVSGSVTFATVGRLLEEGRDQFAGQPAVTVNLKDVSKVDSAGLALLLEWLRQARAEQRKLAFTGLPDKLLAIARLSGVETLLTEGYSGGDSSPASSSSASSSSRSSR